MGNIIVDKRDGVVKLTIDRPPVNVLNIATMSEMTAALEKVKTDQSLKACVITGAGRYFSAGVDVADHTADKVEEMIAVFHGMCRGILSLPMPTVAVLNGPALGGGCEVALCCDMIVASEKAKIGQPEVQVGVFPPVAAALLPRLIGRAKAMELILTGQAIEAAEAQRLGLVNLVVPPENLEQATNDFVARLVGLSAPVLRLTKQAIMAGLDVPFDQALAKAEEIYLGSLMRTEDAHEGLAAFLEKRAPSWKNR